MAVSRSLLAAALLGIALSATPCSAVGLYNMPTSLRQCFGVGFGPGYHADLVLGPVWKAGAEGHHIRYVPSAFTPPQPTGFATPSTWMPTSGVANDLRAYSVPTSHAVAPIQSMAPAVPQGPRLMPEAVPAPPVMR